MESAPSGVPDFPCAGINPLDTLHAPGISRFAKRVAHLATRLETASGTGACDQIAWEEIAIALGYRGNEAQMERCSQIATLGRVRQIHPLFRRRDLADAGPEAYLLGVGGFLPQEPHASETTPLGFPIAIVRDLWNQIDQGIMVLLAVTTDARPTWSMTSVRPENKPVRRLASLVPLMSHWPDDPDPTEVNGYGLGHSAQIQMSGDRAENSMLARVATILARRNQMVHGNPISVICELAELVRVTATLIRPRLVGPARVVDIVVNVLLPLASAWGMLTGNKDLSISACEVYACHPALASNWITREVGRRIGLGGPRDPRSHGAFVQLGMIDLWEGPCRPLARTECPL